MKLRTDLEKMKLLKKSCEQDNSVLMNEFYFKYETGKVIISTGI